MALTPKQRRLRAQIDEIASLVGMEHWDIEKYRPDARTTLLQIMKHKLVRGEVVIQYGVVDELLTNAICDYYFRRAPRAPKQTYRRLWKTKRFRIFVHYIMDEMYLLKKLSVVDAIEAVPTDVQKAIKRINDVRNDVAHSLFPENRRRHMPLKKVLYDGVDLFTAQGVTRFHHDFDLAYDYFNKRALRVQTPRN